MSPTKIAVFFLLILPFCLYFLFPLSLAFGELTYPEESTLHKHWRKYKTKYNKLLGTPLKDFVVNEKTKKIMDKLGDALNAIEVMEKIRDKKDSEAFIKVVEELEKKGIKKLLPNFYKVLTWTSWAKTGMELFKAFAWDPMLLQEQVDTYAAHRLRGMPPEEAITYVAVEFTQLQDLVKNTLAAQYNVKAIYDEKGRILEKWKGKYHETLLAVMELEYNRSYAEKIQEELERKLEEEFEAASDELLASIEAPQLTFEGTLPTDLGVLDVGEKKSVDITYTLANVPPGQPHLARERWSLGDKLSKSHQDEKDITSGTYRLGTELKITSDFEPGDYYLVFQVEVPEHKLSIVSGRIRFKVSDFYIKMKKNLAAAKNLLLLCKSKEAATLTPSAADLEKLAQLKEEDAEIGNLYELAVATDKEIKDTEEALAFYYKFKAVVLNQLSACDFELTDMALQDMNKYVDQVPSACGLKGELEALSKNVSSVRTAFETARERLEEGKNKEADCDYEGAIKDYNQAGKICGGLSCSGARELAGQADSLAAGAKSKVKAKSLLAKGVEEVEKLIKAQQKKKAEEKLSLLDQEADPYKDLTCFSELATQLQNLQVKLQSQLTVKIIGGKPETGLGQGIDFFSEVKLDGMPVKDPDAYTYLWEATDINQPWTQKNVKYIYQQPGKKTIRLTVTDADGRTASATAGLKVAHALRFTLRTDKQPVAVKEKANLSATIEYEPEECPCTYQWTAAGVKGIVTDETVWFSSPKPGTHPVTLTLTNRFQQTATATLNQIVKEPQLAVRITGPAEIGLGQHADFFSEVTLDGAPVTDPDSYAYLWEATDATMPWTGKSVRYPYSAPGQKNVRLTVTDPEGRKATAAVILKVIPALSFTITADKSQILTGEKVNLASSIQGPKEQCPCVYEWTTVNLNKTIPGETAWFSYPKPGTYPINLKVTNHFQQTATATLNVVVNERPAEKPPLAVAAPQPNHREAERVNPPEPDKTRQEAERIKREEAERIKRAEQERVKREQEIRNLQADIARWQKALDCLLEGKRKYPKYWQDCNGNWTMRSRDLEIDNFRKLIKDAQTRLNALGVTPHVPTGQAAEREKARLEAERRKRAEEERIKQEREKARIAEAERQRREAERIKKAEQERIKRAEEIRNLRSKIAEWQKALDCLLEGKRKYPKSDLTCNGNWTMRSRDTEIDNFRKLIKDAQARLNTLTGTASK